MTAHAVPLINGLGGPGGYGPNVLPGNDDGSSDVIDLGPAFPGGLVFFGGPYHEAWVNNNGNITFAGPQYEFTPTPFPIAERPMIAPYWADVDTRGGGAPENNGVYWHLQPGRMVVTWHNVGYYPIRDDLKMDFQMILTNSLDCGEGDFDVEFRYNRCEWTTGSASGGMNGFGGTPAQAGFDAGNLRDFVEIPGSRTMDILNLCTSSNVGEPGIWRFSVRGGAVSCPDTGALCSTGMPGACGVGVTQCVGREVICSPVGRMSAERCDGVDNDCNGSVDDGDGLCAGDGEVCVAGECKPRCFEGGCFEDQTCTEQGVCVDNACLSMTCPDGQRCSRGTCIGACDGVVCPHSRQCVAGRCVDLCSVLTCDENSVCSDGRCIPKCPCHACDVDEVCGEDGSCTPYGCDIMVCDPGWYCDEGHCHDGCEGAVCPLGQHCAAGECVEGPPPDADAGVIGDGDAGSPSSDGDAGEVPSGGEDGSVVEGVDAGPVRRGGRGASAGCACSVPTNGGSSVPWSWSFGSLLVLGFVLARRVRRSRRRGMPAGKLAAVTVAVAAAGAASALVSGCSSDKDNGTGGMDGSVVMGDAGVRPVLVDGCVPSVEICGDHVDQNCDGRDTSCGDTDRDGVQACRRGDDLTRCDCDDSRTDVRPPVGTVPGAEEACDGVDNDCNGRVDEAARCCAGCASLGAHRERADLCNEAGVCVCSTQGAGDAPCGEGQTCCTGGCTDTQTDRTNCGFCGARCTSSADRCTAGNCACGDGPVCDLNSVCAGGVCPGA